MCELTSTVYTAYYNGGLGGLVLEGPICGELDLTGMIIIIPRSIIAGTLFDDAHNSKCRARLIGY